MKPLAEIAIGGKPAGIAMSRDGKFAYLTSPESKELVVVDAAARQVARRFKVGEAPLGIAAHPSNGRVYVADWFTHKVSVVDPAAATVIAEIAVGESPSGLAVTPDGRLLAQRRPRQRRGIDHRRGERTHGLGNVPVGKRPFGITIDAAGQRAYTANVASDDVSVIDIASGKLIGTVPVGHRPYAVALAGQHAFVTNQYASTRQRHRRRQPQGRADHRRRRSPRGDRGRPSGRARVRRLLVRQRPDAHRYGHDGRHRRGRGRRWAAGIRAVSALKRLPYADSSCAAAFTSA